MRKWTLRQNEWYRDNKNLLPSQILDLGRFCIFRDSNKPCRTVERVSVVHLYTNRCESAVADRAQPATETKNSEVEDARCNHRIPGSSFEYTLNQADAAQRKGEQNYDEKNDDNYSSIHGSNNDDGGNGNGRRVQSRYYSVCG